MTKASMFPKKIRVLLVEDHPIVRRGFNLMLAMEPDLMVCGEADNGPEALQKILTLKPDVAVVDLSLKSGSGLELIKHVRAQGSPVRILVFTMRSETLYAERTLRAGANGYLTKDEGTEKAVAAIRLLMQGKPYFSEALSAAMLTRLAGRASAPAGTSFASLSDRELEVLELIGDGRTSREIADQLHISIKTIESHREHLKTKLGLRNASELANYACHWANNQ